MVDYYNVTTNTGDAEIAAAIASNTKLAITHIAFGDGNGAVPTPLKTRTTLVREVHRQAVTKYERHSTNANWIVIETIIPSNIGGFWVREMGVIANGKMISHGSHAPFEKVADPTGVSEYRLKFTLNVKDGNVVNITLDQSLIYASQAWTDENYVPRDEIIDNLTTDDALKPVSAKQAKKLQDNKLDKTANAVSATKLETSRTVQFSGAATGSFNYDGSSNSSSVLTLVNSGVAANTYGGGLKIPVVTVNAKGLITGVSEQNIPIVDNLTTDDATKPVSAKQAKNLQDNKLGKTENAASATNLITGSTAFTDDINFIKSFAGSKLTSWFDDGQGKFFAQYSTGLSASFYNGGTFAIGTEAVTGKAKIMSGVVRSSGVVDFLQTHEIAYVENVLAKSGGTLTGELTAPSIRNKDFYSAGAYSFYGETNTVSERIKCNSILASNTWDDEGNVPEKGIFARGNIVTAGTITSNGLFQNGWPGFVARATVNFNGSNGAVRNGQNISSVTSLGGGTYRVNFITAMPTADYAIVTSLSARGDAASLNIVSQSTTSCTVRANYGGDNTVGSFAPLIACVSIFC